MNFTPENIIKGWLTTMIGLAMICYAFYGYAVEEPPKFTPWAAGGIALCGFLLGFMRTKLEDFVSELVKAAIEKFKNKNV